jgi:hypothetical protein
MVNESEQKNRTKYTPVSPSKLARNNTKPID